MRRFLFLPPLGLLFHFQLASAGFVFLEPSAGFTISPYDNAESSKEMEGTTLGMRAGGRYKRYFLGMDFMYGFLNQSLPQANPKSRPMLLGISGGADLPWYGFRVWTGYYFLNELRIYPPRAAASLDGGAPQTNSVERRTYEGDAFKFGFGWLMTPYSSINFDFIYHHYTSVWLANSNTKVSLPGEVNGKNHKLDLYMYLLSVSFPFDFIEAPR